MKKSLGLGLVLIATLFLNVPSASAATRHARGSVVVDSNRTVYFLGADVRYPFPSMEVFTSWGHKLSDIQKANDADLSLPVGATAKLNYRPVGHLDGVRDGRVFGWVVDKNQPNVDPLPDIYFDGPAGKGTKTSAFSVPVNRPDVNKYLGEQAYIGYYGFEAYVPAEFRDNKQHTIYAYGVDQDDATGKSNLLLAGSPLRFKLAPVTEGPTVVSFTADKTTIYNGEKTEVSWEVSPAGSMVKIDGGFMDSSGSMIVYPENTTAYTIEAVYNGIRVTQSLTITVSDSGQAPRISYFDVYDDLGIQPGESTTLEWETAGANTVTLNNSYVALTGSQKVTPTVTTKYTLAATNGNGTVTKEVTVRVLNATEVRDAQKIEDIISVTIAVLGYQTKHQDKFPDSLQSLVPDYLKSVLVAPTGTSYPCAGSNNDYVYTPSADRTNFTFQYCFEVDHPELSTTDPTAKAGVHVLDYLKETAETAATVADARRAADINQLRVGLELYYDDVGKYPTSMSLLAPKYLTVLPSAPTPTAGTCTVSQNSYTYTQLSGGTDYNLSFCLGSSTGNYSAGVHTISFSGIN